MGETEGEGMVNAPVGAGAGYHGDLPSKVEKVFVHDCAFRL
jgi:hypothetical protein